MLRACFSAHYWGHVLHIWGSLGVIVVFMVIYRPWDFGREEGFLTTSDLHFMGVICLVLASPPTIGSMCLHIWGYLGVMVVFMVMYTPWDLGKHGKSSLIPLISGV